MTTSPQPWSIRLMGANSQRAEVLDASGNVIAHFLDTRDAELVCSWAEGRETITDLKNIISDLELDIEHYKKQIKELQEGEE